MSSHRLALVLAGAFATSAIALGSTLAHGPDFIAGLEADARARLDEAGGRGVSVSLMTPQGWPSRQAVLTGGANLTSEQRTRLAGAVASLPGVAGVGWADAPLIQNGAAAPRSPALRCQEDVAAILKVRSIRFSEASAAIDPASVSLLDEVAAELRPCLGVIIAVTGHTDSAGDERANLALSRARADAVRWSLVARGIPADGLRAAGKGSAEPLPGLAPDDPANRRIEFTVIETVPLRPTPIDTPGPG